MAFLEEPTPSCFFVKAPVFPFDRFPDHDPVLGPEMRSTGEVMGISRHFGHAFAKAQLGAGVVLPAGGAAFLSVNDRDKAALLPAARGLSELGFELLATAGTADHLEGQGLRCRRVKKVAEGRPHVVDQMINGEVALVINTPLGGEAFRDDMQIRTIALRQRIPCITTLSGAMAAVEGIRALREHDLEVRSLQRIAAESMPESPIPAAPAERPGR
jgi:carbamoyl-phosphate synthase large subunit